MAYFKICVRNQRNDGCYPIYIRVTHHRKIGYIKTDKICKSKFVKNGEIVDPFIIKDVYIVINKYIDRLNQVRSDDWDVKDVVDFLKRPDSIINSFSDFAQDFIKKGERMGKRGIVNYKASYNSLYKFMNKDDILFSDLTPSMITDWIYSLRDTKKAKSYYPQYIKSMFKAAGDQFNNLEEGIIIIKGNPFKGVKIPYPEQTEKKALRVDQIRKFFTEEMSIGESYCKRQRYLHFQTVKDICALVFFLVGINTVDLYNMKRSNLKDWKLCYNRSKTKDRRLDRAYIEIDVPDLIRPLFKKYEGKENLFCFSEMYKTHPQFNICVNRKLKIIGESYGLSDISIYTFRHSWATIACNELGVDVGTVGFCLNHASSHRTTWGYIKEDFTKIDKINERMIDLILSKKDGKGLELK